ncbi:putative formin-like protein 5 [Iris pallida]|uniref:Formin-like protein 5 n=1 Tax=Iris pallida TaxID=29817 RepID=A0AAX6FHT6_IRIPA|nr:putative formin-like protein 5 [Iris pallida]
MVDPCSTTNVSSLGSDLGHPCPSICIHPFIESFILEHKGISCPTLGHDSENKKIHTQPNPRTSAKSSTLQSTPRARRDESSAARGGTLIHRLSPFRPCR